MSRAFLMERPVFRPAVLYLLSVFTLASPAAAQLPQKLPIAVLDLRGFYAGLGQDAATADALLLVPDDLPKRGLGGVAGLHFYPLRWNSIALGIGAEGMLAKGRAQSEDAAGTPVGLPVQQRLRSLAFSLSLNFGHREGWSYISAGMGPLTFDTYVGEQAPDLAPPAASTLNLGAGARWFPKPHLAFCFDLRFYQTKPEVQSGAYPPRKRSQLFVLSAGISVK